MNTVLLSIDTTLLDVAGPCCNIHWQIACLAWMYPNACVLEAAVLKSICTCETLAAGASRTANLPCQTVLQAALEKKRQDKTRQDKTRQDKTRQDKKRKEKKRKEKKRKEKKRKEKKRKEKKRKEKKRKEEKRKEKTTPFGVNLMRSQVLYRAAQGQAALLKGRTV